MEATVKNKTVIVIADKKTVQTIQLLIFRTNLKNKKRVRLISPLLNKHPLIKSWSIDIEDIDNVLRIEGLNNLKESTIISLIERAGHYCDTLDD